MIEIRLAELETTPPSHLTALADMLYMLAGKKQAPPVVEVRTERQYAAVPDAVKMGVIAPEDLPNVGADPEPSAAQVFGAGNVAAGATSSTTAAPSTAADSGNEAGGPLSTTQDGTPPAQSNGTQTAGATIDLDKNGLPWDVRIHAGTKRKNADGTWTARRGTDAAVVAQVEAELRAVMGIPLPPVGNAQTGAPASPPGVPSPPAVPAPPTTAASAPATIPTPPAGAATPGIKSFAQLLPAVTNGLTSGALTEARIAEVLAQHGVSVLPQLAPRPDLVAAVAAALFPGQ